MNGPAVLCAIASAALFGASIPVAKVLLGTIYPAVLAGLLYCGAGAGIALLRWFLSWRTSSPAPQVPLQSKDFPSLIGAIAAGGTAGPLLLMYGLAHTEASTASLLLTLEGAATALIAWFAFREGFDRRIAIGMVCLVAGAAILSWSGSPSWQEVSGPLAIVCACIAWGIDNNLTRKISLSDPLEIVQWKGFVAGPTNLALGLLAGAALPGPATVGLAAIVGFLSYGVSLALFVLALRGLGAARTGAYFSTAPFIGAVIATVVLSEPVTGQLVAAGALMAIGVWLHLSENHDHDHEHDTMDHAHPHMHDEHHQHAHGPDDPPGEPHTHRHRHAPLTHRHPHTPDMHHPHSH